MKIGIVVPNLLEKKVFDFLEGKLKHTTLIPFSYEKFMDIPPLIIGHQHQVDVLFFLGETTRKYASRHVHQSIPWLLVPRTATALVRVILQATLQNLPLRFATDIQDPSFFSESIAEVNLNLQPSDINFIPTIPYDETFPNKMAQAFEKEYESGNSAFCITMFGQIEKILRQKGIPVFLIYPSLESIYNAIHEVTLSSLVTTHSDLQIAVIRISIDSPKDVMNYTPHTLAILHLQATREIQKLASFIAAPCIPVSEHEYIIFTTKGIVDRDTNHMTKFQLLSNIQQIGVTLSIGIGVGANAAESNFFALHAMKQAISSGGNRLFIMNNSDYLSGPFYANSSMSADLPDKQILSISNETGVSVRYISLIYLTCQNMGKNHFTPAELADAIGIRLRTMNRILLKLLDHNYCKETGKYFSQQRGRPSRVIEIKQLDD